MNPHQYALQLKHLLQAVTWHGPYGQVVFGSGEVRVIAGTPTEDQIPSVFPFVLVNIGAGAPDPTHPDLIEQTFTLMVAVMSFGDAMGEHALIGGPASDLNRSEGRGVSEVSERSRFALQDLTGADGALIQATASGISTPANLSGNHVVVEEWTLSALCLSQLHYAEPAQLEFAGGTWTWVGSQCSNRFDFVQFRLGFVTGATPVSDPDLAVTVYTGTDPFVTVTAIAGRAYSVWAEYSSRRRVDDIEAASDGALVGTFVAV